MLSLFWTAFWTTTLSGGLLILLLFWSMAVPSWRIWPPPIGKASWQFWLVWTFVILLVTGDMIVAVLDSGSLGLSALYRVIGIVMIILGNCLAWWGVALLGGWTTTGLAGPIVTTGPYRFSRNPQYLGDALIVIGVILASDSALSICPSLLAALCAFAAPFAEEPWLCNRLGPEYEAYLRKVPRFLGPF
ncbi:MAG: isoprenylcysteine carboxylmethyltransferase family protein [Alphaproteobacteria bacterium]|nr:isoprenylcysteine carboxylmethyltransferase family protein [Alphaproteobacteria bacterium]